MKNALAPLFDALARLAPRERVMVIAAAIVVTLTVIYLALWEPLVQYRAREATNLESARALANRLEVIGAQVAAQRGSTPAATASRNLSLLAAVDQAARAGTLGKPPARLQPEGDNEVRVWLERTAFDGMVRWVHELDRQHGIVVSTADIERLSEPGLVDARLTLVRP